MWVKIEIIPGDREIITLPQSMLIKDKDHILVNFGKKSSYAEIKYYDYEGEGSFENPFIIRFSDRLKDRLLICESLVYRVTVSDDGINIGPVIGLLLGIHTHRYNPRHMKKYSDRLGIYNKVGGLIYAFSPKSIDWNNHTAYGLYYNIITKSWKYGCFPLPEVIYRRDFHSDPKQIAKLIEYTGGRLFNSYRFTKYELYDYLSTNKDLRNYLPPTEQLTNFQQIKKFTESYGKIILKPVDLSRGRGIAVIEKMDTVYKITDYRYKNPISTMLYDNDSLENYFMVNHNFFNKYILQKYLSLARIGDELFDVRVVMQKGKDRLWKCSGIECRVSGSSSHLTNISRGGYALTLDESLQRAFVSGYNSLPQRIHEFCQSFCSYMDMSGEHFAEFGMDIAVDTDKNIWLIEANVFPSFKGFKNMDRQTYLGIRYTPLLYALSLTQFENNI